MLENRQNGFSLIEVLIVLLIAGILLSFSVYSVNLLDKQHQNSTITQLKNNINSIQRKAQMLNFPMRIRHITEEKNQKIITEYFNANKRAWLLDSTMNIVALDNDSFSMSTPFIEVRPSGFITQGTFCIDDKCENVAELAQDQELAKE